MQTPTLTQPNSDQEAVEKHLIESARKILEMHYSHYNWIDQKAQRFLTLVGAVEGYFIINFFLNRKFDISDASGLLMLIALVIGAVVVILYISILQSRPFYNGPNIEAQADDFRPNGKIEEVRKDTLATLKISYQENVKIINAKAKLFKISIWGLALYFTILVMYFALLKSNAQDIPNDILLGTHQTLMTDDLLITDNLGAVEANTTDIVSAEEENTQEELSEEVSTNEETESPVLPADELQSDNVDVVESGPQPDTH